METSRWVNLRNADHYGFEVQKDQCIEECAELIQALNKYSRASGKGQATDMSVEEALKNVIEEVADVEVMLEQIIYLLNIGRIQVEIMKMQKILRTETKIEKEKEKLSE